MNETLAGPLGHMASLRAQKEQAAPGGIPVGDGGQNHLESEVITGKKFPQRNEFGEEAVNAADPVTAGELYEALAVSRAKDGGYLVTAIGIDWQGKPESIVMFAGTRQGCFDYVTARLR
jgi:hypothetical protein